jgi:hypothetical protein
MKITTGTDRKTNATIISISGTPEEKIAFRRAIRSQSFAVLEKDQSHFLVPNNAATAAFIAKHA